MAAIEEVILRHSNRGALEIRRYVSDNCCEKAAQEIMSWEKGVIFLTTGFYVDGHAETDGPVGTVVLARALRRLGFEPVIVTDAHCQGFFELEKLPTEYVAYDADRNELQQLIQTYQPRGMISIERCGKNKFLKYANMRGISIDAYTAPIDELFVLCQGSIPTIGVGDGGNEIGMGKIAGAISRKLSLEPCVVSTDILVVASVSNWGAYGIVTALSGLAKEYLLPSFAWIESYIAKTVRLGSVDGVTHQKECSVDGKSMSTEQEIVLALKKIEQGGVCA